MRKPTYISIGHVFMPKEENRDMFNYLEKEMMSYGMISGSKTCFLLCPKLPTQLPTKSNPLNCSGLVFSPNLVIKQSKSIKFPCGLHRGRTRVAINGLYGVKQENLYDVLGVSENGTTSEIKEAYKKLALKYHPDLSQPDPKARAIMGGRLREQISLLGGAAIEVCMGKRKEENGGRSGALEGGEEAVVGGSGGRGGLLRSER